MPSIVETVKSLVLDGDVTESFAEIFGGDSEKTEKAVSAAVPALLKGMSERSDSSEVVSLVGSKTNMAGELSELLGSEDSDELINGFLGDSRDGVVATVAAKSGASKDQISKLLPKVSQVVAAVVGDRVVQDKVDADGLSALIAADLGEDTVVVAKQKAKVAATSVADAVVDEETQGEVVEAVEEVLVDNQEVTEVANVVSSPTVTVEETKRRGSLAWLWWLLGAILVLAAIAWALIEFNKEDELTVGDVEEVLQPFNDDSAVTHLEVHRVTDGDVILAGAADESVLDNVVDELSSTGGVATVDVSQVHKIPALAQEQQQLADAVRDALSEVEGVELDDLAIEVTHDNKVVLGGVVEDGDLRDSVIDAVVGVEGVEGVEDLTLTRAEADVNTRQGIIEYLTLQDIDSVDVQVAGGVVTLSGEVGSDQAVEDLVADVSDIGFVTEVENNLTVVKTDDSDKEANSTTTTEKSVTDEDPTAAIELEGVAFAENSAALTKSAKTYLRKDVLPLLLKDENVRYEIQGHTNNIGDGRDNGKRNAELSDQRANEVRDYLVAQAGADRKALAKRLDANGYGSSRPKVPHNSANAATVNRRVEVVVVK